MGDMIDRDDVIARLRAYGTASTEKAAAAIAALPAVTQPAPDAAAIREAADRVFDLVFASSGAVDARKAQSIVLALLTEKPHDRA